MKVQVQDTKLKKDISSHNWKIYYFWSKHHSSRWQRRNIPLWSIASAIEEKIKINKTLNKVLKGRNHEQCGVSCRRLSKKKKYLSSVSFCRSKESHCWKLLSNKTFQKHMRPKSVFFEDPCFLKTHVCLMKLPWMVNFEIWTTEALVVKKKKSDIL